MSKDIRTLTFCRSGLAALADLKDKVFYEVFKQLERDQANFIEEEKRFRSPEYRWPHDSLHTWSRVWEYPYAYFHLKYWQEEKVSNALLRVADLGCGVTFFPFSVARLGYHVLCTDIDPLCGKDLELAMKFLIQEPGTIEFRLTNGSDLPFSNEELDAIYCISVLEHVPNIKQTIAEMFRILKPGGLLILTIDLDLRGDAEIGFENHRRLTEYLQQYFSYFYPETTIHPADMLNTISSPYAMKKPGLLEFLWFILKQHIAKPLVGKKPGYVPPSRLAVQGFVMTKKA